MSNDSSRVYYQFDPAIHVRPVPADAVETGGAVGMFSDDNVRVSCTIRSYRMAGYSEPIWWVTDEKIELGDVYPAQDRVPRERRIDTINRLLCDANGTRRLFVSDKCEDTISALRWQERDDDGRSEQEPMHLWTAALGMAAVAAGLDKTPVYLVGDALADDSPRFKRHVEGRWTFALEYAEEDMAEAQRRAWNKYGGRTRGAMQAMSNAAHSMFEVLVRDEVELERYEEKQREDRNAPRLPYVSHLGDVTIDNFKRGRELWSAQVRAKVAALPKPGPRVYCQGDDDE